MHIICALLELFLLLQSKDNKMLEFSKIQGKQDLTERLETYTTQRYVSQSVPMGDAISSYTTYTDASVEGALRRLHRKVLSAMYEPDDECMREYFNLMQDNYKEEVDDYIGELKRWRVEVRARKCHWPRREDYEEKRMEICHTFCSCEPNFPVEQYFSCGADDTADAGAYLLSLPSNEMKETKERLGILIFSCIQWLVRERDALPIGTSDAPGNSIPDNTPPSEEITYDKALKTLLVDYLKLNTEGTNVKIGEKTWNKTRVVVATMHVLKTRGTLRASNDKEYAVQIAPLIDRDSEALRKNISSVQQEIKPYGRNLKDLDEAYIKNNPPSDGKGMSTRTFRNSWEGMYDVIDAFINTKDNLNPLRGKNA